MTALTAVDAPGDPSPVIGSDVYDVRVYGAVVDGAHDDVDAVNRAIDAANAAGGGIVFIPAGTILVGQSSGFNGIVMKTGVRLIGAGRNVTIVKVKDGGNARAITATDISYFEVAHLTVNGNRANQTAGVHAFSMSGCSHYDLHHMVITGAYGYGMGLQSGTFRHGLHRSIYITDSGNDGIDYKNANDDNEAITFDHITVEGFDMAGAGGKAGIDVRGPANLSNIVILGVPNSCAGIRFRQATGALDGARKSNLVNFRVVGTSITGSFGVYAADPNTKISNGWVENVVTGLQDLGGRTGVTNVQARGCTTGLRFDTDGGSLVADSSVAANCLADTCTTGFLVNDATAVRLIGNTAENCTTGINVQAGSVDTLLAFNRTSTCTTPLTDAGTGTVTVSNI